jgi:hypothetical protein
MDDLIDILNYKFISSFRVLDRAFKYSGTALFVEYLRGCSLNSKFPGVGVNYPPTATGKWKLHGSLFYFPILLVAPILPCRSRGEAACAPTLRRGRTSHGAVGDDAAHRRGVAHTVRPLDEAPNSAWPHRVPRCHAWRRGRR